MKAFSIQLGIQFKNDIRDKNTLLVYYIIPLLFYFVMGSIFNSIYKGQISPVNICVMLSISMAAFLGLPQMLVKARESGVLQAYKVAGIPSWSLLLSNILIVFVHILIVTLIILLTAPLMFGPVLPDNLPQFFAVVMLVTLASEALGTLLCAFVKKQTTMGLVGQLLFLPSLMFTGMMFPAEFLPKALQKVGSVLPASFGMKILLGSETVWPNILALTGIIIVAFAVSAWMYKKISYSK